MKDNVYQICLYLYSAFSIPTIYISNNENIMFEFPETDDISQRKVVVNKIKSLFDSNRHPGLFSFSPSNLFGKISISDSEDYIIVGPLKNDSFSSTPFEDEFLEKESLNFEYRNFSFLPIFNFISASNLLAFIHYLVNDQVISINQEFGTQHSTKLQKTYQIKTNKMIEKKENETRHNTYYLEEEMLAYIRRGDKKKLLNFLETKMSIHPIRAGKMASSPIRQEKNIFLAALTKVGNQAAIPGGMNVEEAYELIDTYSLECESLSDIASIAELHSRMLIDFCENVHQSKKRAAISSETQKIIDFINERTNRPIQLDDLVDYTGKSKSYLNRLFRNEVGMTIANFIRLTKLNESKDLLTYTEMSISEIANYLSFSNQSHFQNCFKSQFHETPNNYRKKRKITLFIN